MIIMIKHKLAPIDCRSLLNALCALFYSQTTDPLYHISFVATGRSWESSMKDSTDWAEEGLHRSNTSSVSRKYRRAGGQEVNLTIKVSSRATLQIGRTVNLCHIAEFRVGSLWWCNTFSNSPVTSCGSLVGHYVYHGNYETIMFNLVGDGVIIKRCY